MMKKSAILGVAISVYLAILAGGGAAYYYAKETHASATPQEQEQHATPPTRSIEEAAESRESQIENLEAKMQTKVIGGATYYTQGYSDKPPTGVYLRPFVGVGTDGACVLKHDVYYYYSIDDPAGTNWIFGDHIDITADGKTYTEAFDSQQMRKHIASNAEALSEHYVVNADPAITDALRRVGNAKHASIRYYKKGGKERSHTLTTTEKQKIQETVALYDLLSH